MKVADFPIRLTRCGAKSINLFHPPPASWEVDQACFVSVERARQLLHPDQAVFVDWLLEHLDQGEAGGG